MPVVKRLIGCLIIPVFFATAWDIAVITDNEIQFLQDEKFIGVSVGNLKGLTSGAYDPVRGDLYVGDSDNRNTSLLLRISTLSSKHETGFLPIVSKQHFVVEGIAFDPVTNTLFWSTGSGKAIYKITANHSAKSLDFQTADVLHKFSDEIPFGIAVDSCRQYIYWTNCNSAKPSIERSRIDGTGHEVIVNDKLFQPLGIVVDAREKKVYWSNQQDGIYYRIERSDLDGKNRVSSKVRVDHHPVDLSLAGGNIYWVDWMEKNLWSLPKDSLAEGEPKKVENFKSRTSISIISSTLYLDMDPKECPLLAPYADKIKESYANSRSLTQRDTIREIFDSDDLDSPPPFDYCLNNGTLSNGVCMCGKGYSGVRCEISTCHNYCVHGTCEMTASTEPTCHCPPGYSGSRCEVDRCLGMCLNSGACVVGDNNETSCSCKTGYSGDRCEFLTDVIGELCKLYCEYSEASPLSQSTTAGYGDRVNGFPSSLLRVCSCSEHTQSSANDPYERLADDQRNQNQQHLVSELNGRFNVLVTSSLGILCIILAVTVILLTTKVYVLRKRPRIRKRIVVSKPPAPFACRPQSPPDLCEITIENCCNMNICETPCFEPDFRSTKATFKKSKSEDKKMLIGSMHSNSSQDEENY